MTSRPMELELAQLIAQTEQSTAEQIATWLESSAVHGNTTDLRTNIVSAIRSGAWRKP